MRRLNNSLGQHSYHHFIGQFGYVSFASLLWAQLQYGYFTNIQGIRTIWVSLKLYVSLPHQYLAWGLRMQTMKQAMKVKGWRCLYFLCVEVYTFIHIVGFWHHLWLFLTIRGHSTHQKEFWKQITGMHSLFKAYLLKKNILYR